jgi:hypothetical protein
MKTWLPSACTGTSVVPSCPFRSRSSVGRSINSPESHDLVDHRRIGIAANTVKLVSKNVLLAILMKKLLEPLSGLAGFPARARVPTGSIAAGCCPPDAGSD